MMVESPEAAGNRRRAILCVLGSSGSFTLVSALVKAVSPEVPLLEVMLFRSGVAALIMVPLILRQGGLSALRSRRPWGHVARGLTGLGGMFGSFYGYAKLPLAAVTALGFAMPLLLTLLSVPLLGERITWSRGVAVGAGLLGVILVIRPWQGAEGLPLFDTMVVLAGVLAWALSMVSIRRLGMGGERNVTIVSLFTLFTSLCSCALAVPVLMLPRPWILLLLVGVGAISAGAQLLMTEGYRSGEASMLAPFEYSAIVYTVAMGWLIWGERPGAWEGCGMAVLVGAGLFTWYRETRAGRADRSV